MRFQDALKNTSFVPTLFVRMVLFHHCQKESLPFLKVNIDGWPREKQHIKINSLAYPSFQIHLTSSMPRISIKLVTGLSSLAPFSLILDIQLAT